MKRVTVRLHCSKCGKELSEGAEELLCFRCAEEDPYELWESFSHDHARDYRKNER
jgi:hypothetical protein